MKHHYIPQFYLRPWCGADHKLQEFRKSYQGRIQTGRYGPKSTGYEVDLYALDGVLPEARQKVEQTFMSLVDSKAKLVRDMLVAGDVPTDPARRGPWVQFIMSLLLRNPESVQTLKDRHNDIWRKPDGDLERAFKENRKHDDPDTLQGYIEKYGSDSFTLRAVILLTELTNQPAMTELIANMRWGVMRSPRPLVTSDRPVVLVDNLRGPNGHVVMPISPNRLFVAASFDFTLRRFMALNTSKVALKTNESVMRQARKYIYAVDKAPGIKVRRYMSTVPDKILVAERQP